MVAVDVPIEESYDALQRGVTDCQVQYTEWWQVLGLTEGATEYVPVPLAQSRTFFVMNLDTWESLPAAVQQIMHEEVGPAALSAWEVTLAGSAKFGELIDAGSVRVNDATSLIPVIDAQADEWLDEMAASAPDGVDDPQAVIDDYVDRHDYWVQALVDLGYEVPVSDPSAVRESFSALQDVDLSEFADRFDEEVVAATSP